MKRRVFLSSLVLAACVPSASSPPAAHEAERDPDGGVPKPAWKRSCTEYARAPVQVDYEEAVGGAGVLYRTQGDVAALRQRTREVAAFHNASKSKIGALHDLFAIPHRASVEEIEGGARLLLVPKSVSPKQLESLRINVQQEVIWLRRRGCGTGQEAL